MTEKLEAAFWCVKHPICDTMCTCGRKAEMWHVERTEVVVCPHCRIYDIVGSNLLSSWREETADVWRRRAAILDTFSQGKMYFPGDTDAPPHILEKLHEAEWDSLLEDFSSGSLDRRMNDDGILF